MEKPLVRLQNFLEKEAKGSLPLFYTKGTYIGIAFAEIEEVNIDIGVDYRAEIEVSDYRTKNYMISSRYHKPISKTFKAGKPHGSQD